MLVQVVELVLRKLSYALYQALGVYLPLITTNCAVLGATILNVDSGYNLVESVVNGFGAGHRFYAGHCALFRHSRKDGNERILPAWMKGFPGALIAAGLMAVAFSALQG